MVVNRRCDCNHATADPDRSRSRMRRSEHGSSKSCAIDGKTLRRLRRRVCGVHVRAAARGPRWCVPAAHPRHADRVISVGLRATLRRRAAPDHHRDRRRHLRRVCTVTGMGFVLVQTFPDSALRAARTWPVLRARRRFVASAVFAAALRRDHTLRDDRRHAVRVAVAGHRARCVGISLVARRARTHRALEESADALDLFPLHDHSRMDRHRDRQLAVGGRCAVRAIALRQSAGGGGDSVHPARSDRDGGVHLAAAGANGRCTAF